MTATINPRSGGGNPAFDRHEVQSALVTPSTDASMSVGGVFVKSLAFLVVLVAAGLTAGTPRWTRPPWTQPVGTPR